MAFSYLLNANVRKYLMSIEDFNRAIKVRTIHLTSREKKIIVDEIVDLLKNLGADVDDDKGML